MALKDRARAKALGRQTVDIIRRGRYDLPAGHVVDLAAALDASVKGTIEYPPHRHPQMPARGSHATRITVANETVLAVGRRMARHGPVAALNFASAESPGGGFLHGALAQEESIARSSGLYAALEGCAMYEYHRARRDAMYSDWVIYSPAVPMFRTDAGDLLEDPWTMSIITSPAVHATGIRKYTPEREREIPVVMTARTAKVLAVGAAHEVTRLIVGAWGCGAFGGDPGTMAGIFRDALEGPFEGVFAEVVFAITDWSADERFIGPFTREFAPQR